MGGIDLPGLLADLAAAFLLLRRLRNDDICRSQGDRQMF